MNIDFFDSVMRQVFNRFLDGALDIPRQLRNLHAEKDDQTRVMTPLQARAQGSDYIVVGRPVTAAADPAAAYARCVREFVLGQE